MYIKFEKCYVHAYQIWKNAILAKIWCWPRNQLQRSPRHKACLQFWWYWLSKQYFLILGLVSTLSLSFDLVTPNPFYIILYMLWSHGICVTLNQVWNANGHIWLIYWLVLNAVSAISQPFDSGQKPYEGFSRYWAEIMSVHGSLTLSFDLVISLVYVCT